MSSSYVRILDSLAQESRHWLITGCAGFIGSHLLAKLLEAGQRVTGLDNLSTGKKANLGEVRAQVGAAAWEQFRMIEGDISEAALCREAARGADFVLHEAALVSVPLSIEEPLRCNRINVDGFLNVLDAARVSGVKRFVYASSSAIYGDSPEMPIREDAAGRPSSPYGISKKIGEQYADVFSRNYGLTTVGLRYFNVFGPRQDPSGGYPAVIPKWISASVDREPCRIHGDGSNTRDFCHVANVVQANILAAMTPLDGSDAFNVGLGGRTSLNELHSIIVEEVERQNPAMRCPAPIHEPARAGDIIHSQADISKIQSRLGYEPLVSLSEGIREVLRWRAEQTR